MLTDGTYTPAPVASRLLNQLNAVPPIEIQASNFQDELLRMHAEILLLSQALHERDLEGVLVVNIYGPIGSGKTETIKGLTAEVTNKGIVSYQVQEEVEANLALRGSVDASTNGVHSLNIENAQAHFLLADHLNTLRCLEQLRGKRGVVFIDQGPVGDAAIRNLKIEDGFDPEVKGILDRIDESLMSIRPQVKYLDVVLLCEPGENRQRILRRGRDFEIDARFYQEDMLHKIQLEISRQLGLVNGADISYDELTLMLLGTGNLFFNKPQNPSLVILDITSIQPQNVANVLAKFIV